MEMNLRFMGIQTLKKYRDASSKFPTTFIFVNDANADYQTPKNNALIFTFNYEKYFS